jgi:hypothetical protein
MVNKETGKEEDYSTTNREIYLQSLFPILTESEIATKILPGLSRERKYKGDGIIVTTVDVEPLLQSQVRKTLQDVVKWLDMLCTAETSRRYEEVR